MNHRAGADIVLVGGGHAHVQVLRAFALRPEPGVRLTLISRELATLYSAMLPGVIAGFYTPEQAHIDLMLKYTDADIHNLAAYLNDK